MREVRLVQIWIRVSPHCSSQEDKRLLDEYGRLLGDIQQSTLGQNLLGSLKACPLLGSKVLNNSKFALQVITAVTP